MIKSPIATIVRSPLFSGLSQGEIEELAHHCEVMIFDNGYSFFSQGDPSEDIYVVVDGRVRLTVRDTADNEQDIGVVESGDIIGEMGVFESEPRSTSAYALGETVLLKVPGDGFQAMMKAGHPAIHKMLQWSLKKAGERLRQLDHKLGLLF